MSESATMAAAEKLFGDVLVAVNGASPLGISIRGQARERLVAVLLDALQQAQAARLREAWDKLREFKRLYGDLEMDYSHFQYWLWQQIEARAGEGG